MRANQGYKKITRKESMRNTNKGNQELEGKLQSWLVFTFLFSFVLAAGIICVAAAGGIAVRLFNLLSGM